MSDKKEIYERLAEMIELCTESVKVCIPRTDYHRRADEWSGDTITIINANTLINILRDEAFAIEQEDKNYD